MKFLHILPLFLCFKSPMAQEILNSPCPETEICVIGSGKSLAMAQNSGRSEMAKYFETKVSVESQVSSESKQVGLIPNAALFEEWTSKVISEETSEILSGITEKKVETKDDDFYVLMSIDKAKTAKYYRDQVELIDQENEILFNKNSRFAFPKLFLNLKKRQHLTKRYFVLTGSSILAKVSDEKVLQSYHQLKPLSLSYLVEGKRISSPLIQLVAKNFSEVKCQLKNKGAALSFQLKLIQNIREEYFKVEGFKKINIELKLQLISGEKDQGEVIINTTQVGRSFNQALEKGLEELETELIENLDKLSL